MISRLLTVVRSMSARVWPISLMVVCVLVAISGARFSQVRAVPSDARATYQYFVQFLAMGDIQKSLNQHGAEGWEIAFVGTPEPIPMPGKNHDPSLKTEGRLVIFKQRTELPHQ